MILLELKRTKEQLPNYQAGRLLLESAVS